MELKSEKLLPSNPDLTWEALNDPEVLQQCIPGCESMTRLEDGGADPKYEMGIVVAVGPVKAKFKARMTILNIVAPSSYTIAFEGQGGAAGHAKGKAHVTLEPSEEYKTRLLYEATVTIGGRIAQVGSRLVDIAAKKLASDFFDRFDALMAPPGADDTTEVATASGKEGELKRSWWRRIANQKP
jgi:uncharacterized protein